MHLGSHMEVAYLSTQLSFGVIALKRFLSVALHLIIMSYQSGLPSNS